MKFNYALDDKDYTIKNALLWGNCHKHFKKAGEGRLGPRIIHGLIGTAELIPIGALFELAIVKAFSTKEESFKKFKHRVLSKLPETTKAQKAAPSYARAKLKELPDKHSNPPIKLDKAPKGISLYAEKATFYGYNAEGIRDHGWGCAWRAIQTCLSAYGIATPFEELFHLFGPSDNLKAIYKDKYPKENLSSLKKFAPYDLSSGWAEPFIGEMAMHFYGIMADLETVNGIPGCYTPKSSFHHPSLSFDAFKARLQDHFETKNAAPVMIDDGIYTLNIIGLGFEDSNTLLWIADPHIGEGVNRAPSKKTANGLYTITLDASGNQIDNSLNKNDKHQKSHLFNARSYDRLHFNEAKWMVLFPKTHFPGPLDDPEKLKNLA